MTSKTIIVTGASRGVGAATARIASRQGASVVLFARTRDDLERETEAIVNSGGKAISVVGDVSNSDDCARLIETSVNAYGKIDSLVNNAGIIQPLDIIADMDERAWIKCWNVNFLGSVMLTKHAIPFLREKHGRIINISSGAAMRTIRGWGAYSTAKAALDHFTRILAVEEEQITCVGVRPGVVDTAMQETIISEGKAGMPEEEYERFVKQRKEGKLISPNLPAVAVTALALAAPKIWSGMILDWNDAKLQQLASEVSS